MAVRATAIPTDVLDILKRGMIIAGNAYCLPAEQLPRDVYERVNKVLVGLGGKWNRTKRAHIFKFDPAEALGLAFENGKFVDRKKALQFFETPAEIARRMVELAEIKKTDLVLEPSAGHGALITALPQNHPGSYVNAIEIDAENCRVLKERFPTITVVQSDFTTASNFGGHFDVILMNPPFTSGQDIDHIRKAWDWLDHGGRLIAICADNKGYRSDRKHVAFRAWLDEIGAEQEPIPHGAFKASGTEVATRLIWATKGPA